MVMGIKTDVLIVGGGFGGCAAAISAASMGKRVVLTEETDWLGGQATSQAVPPDEHPWIESFGCTRRYREFRNRTRDYYRRNYPLTAEARAAVPFNPGGGTVSRICAEPRVYLAAIYEMMAPAILSGRLTILLEHVPVYAETNGNRVCSVTLTDRRTGDNCTVEAPYILDATELGDLLPMTGTEYVSGAESKAETGEPHAADKAAPDNVQALTWCFAVGYDPCGNHVIDKPATYNFWRDYVPTLAPAWSGPLLSWTYSHPITLEPFPRTLFESKERPNLPPIWTYRRVINGAGYPESMGVHDVTLVNWPQNDYLLGNIIDKPEEEVSRHLEASRELSRSLLYWMQTEAPRPDGGTGYPGLYPRPDITGAPEGLAKYPYIRESRRIKARFTVTELHVGAQAHGGVKAAQFKDSVGVGAYRIDLHPSTGGDNYIDISSLPFQIPLGAMIPVRMQNLLPACKNIGTTHISNGCYRLHPVEWNIGESAGFLASFCLDKNVQPAHVWEQPELLADFQSLLQAEGVELDWPALSAL
jgi:hypothetical protein